MGNIKGIPANKVKNGDRLWAYAYNVDRCNHEYHAYLKQKPVFGVIEGERFKILKKDGTPQSKGVDKYARRYAETEHEAIVLYNELVEINIQRLRNQVYRMSLDLIEEEDN